MNNYKLIGVLAIVILLVAGGFVFLSFGRREEDKNIKKVAVRQERASERGEEKGSRTRVLKANVLEVTIDKSGFLPEKINTTTDTVIKFENKTREIVAIVPVGEKKLQVGEIFPGEILLSMPLVEKGVYIFAANSENGRKGEITVE